MISFLMIPLPHTHVLEVGQCLPKYEGDERSLNFIDQVPQGPLEGNVVRGREYQITGKGNLNSFHRHLHQIPTVLQFDFQWQSHLVSEHSAKGSRTNTIECPCGD